MKRDEWKLLERVMDDLSDARRENVRLRACLSGVHSFDGADRCPTCGFAGLAVSLPVEEQQ